MKILKISANYFCCNQTEKKYISNSNMQPAFSGEIQRPFTMPADYSLILNKPKASSRITNSITDAEKENIRLRGEQIEANIPQIKNEAEKILSNSKLLQSDAKKELAAAKKELKEVEDLITKGLLEASKGNSKVPIRKTFQNYDLPNKSVRFKIQTDYNGEIVETTMYEYDREGKLTRKTGIGKTTKDKNISEFHANIFTSYSNSGSRTVSIHNDNSKISAITLKSKSDEKSPFYKI